MMPRSLIAGLLALAAVMVLGVQGAWAQPDSGSESGTEGLLGSQLPVTAERFSYTSDGLEINAWMARPDVANWRKKKWPLIIYNHGDFKGLGPERGALRLIAGRGAVVAASHYRGEGGSEGEVEFAVGEVRDVAELRDLMLSKPWIDRERTAMVGFSHGGLITLKLLADRVRTTTAALISTPWELTAIDRLERGSWRREWAADLIGCDVAECPVEYRRRSLTGELSLAGMPVMLLHGTEDRIVPVESADRLADKLRDAGAELIYRRVAGLDHEAVLVYELMTLVSFLNEHLQGFGPAEGPVDPSPGRAEGEPGGNS